jgi:hypothetical protein
MVPRDRLKGPPDAIHPVRDKTTVQTFILRILRNSFGRESKKQTPTAKYRKPEQTAVPQSGCAEPFSPEFARKWDKITIRRSQAAGECTGDPEIRAVIY